MNREGWVRKIEIRTTDERGFRNGQWARLKGVVLIRYRPCYEVKFPDGVTDAWVIADPNGRYEFRERRNAD